MPARVHAVTKAKGGNAKYLHQFNNFSEELSISFQNILVLGMSSFCLNGSMHSSLTNFVEHGYIMLKFAQTCGVNARSSACFH